MRCMLTATLIGLLLASSAEAQAGPSSTPSSTSPAGGAQQNPNASSPGAANPPSPQGGITNGTLPIEATAFAYKALNADATNIARAVLPKTKGQIVVVGTVGDVNAIIQFRVVMGQGRLLEQRVSSLASALSGISVPTYSKPVSKQVAAGTPFITSPSDVATLIQTIGSMTAVNESESAAPGALNDATLIADVAQQVEGNVIYMPSVFPPGLFGDVDLSHTQVGGMLGTLENAREAAIAETASYSQALADAQTVSTGGTAQGYTAADVAAANGVLERATTINSLITLIGGASSAIDSFEGSLLSGQGSPPSSSPQSSGPSPQTAQQQAALPGVTPAPPVGQNQQNTQTPQTSPASPQSNPAPSTSVPAGTLLQQILYADLLLTAVVPKGPGSIEFLAVHALESGGGQWTHSNLFAGSWISFSGGAVASYALFRGDGVLQCSGVAYAYRGIVKEKWVETALRPEGGISTAITGTCSSPTPAQGD